MTPTTLVLLLFILMVGLFSAVTANHVRCNKRNKVGKCILIQHCPALHALSQNDTLAPESLNILLNFQCGYKGIIPKVCCVKNIGLQSLNLDTGNEITPTSSLLPDYNDCGLSLPNYRRLFPRAVVGGLESTRKEFPWLALLFYKNLTHNYITYSCGGALISRRYVLTAAHCVKGKMVKGFQLEFIRLGEYIIGKTYHFQDIGFEEIIPHAGWVDDESRFNDIALVRLKRDVNFSPLIRPICLPNKGREIPTAEENFKLFTYLWVAGWGVTEAGIKSDVKMKLSIPVRSISECQEKYQKHVPTAYLNEHIQICAGGEPGKDTCFGDSGGPAMSLHIDNEGEKKWFSTGIVSFGPNPCGTINYSAVYTRTNSYIDWILSNMRP